MKELQREVRELKQANDILRKASAFFAAADLDRLRKRMIMFVDDHREHLGVDAYSDVSAHLFRQHPPRYSDASAHPEVLP